MISLHISLHVLHNNLPLQCTKQEVLLTKNEKNLKNQKLKTKNLKLLFM